MNCSSRAGQRRGSSRAGERRCFEMLEGRTAQAGSKDKSVPARPEGGVLQQGQREEMGQQLSLGIRRRNEASGSYYSGFELGWARLGQGHCGLHSVLRLKFGRFHQNFGCPSSRLACCLGRKVRRRCKTTKCFGERIYLFDSNILVVFHKMKLDFLW